MQKSASLEALIGLPAFVVGTLWLKSKK